MERDERHLEPEADEDEGETEEQEGREPVACDRLRHDVEPGAPCGAVEEGDPVEQEPGREGAEQEVLERRLVRADLLPEHADQHVDRHRHDLEREEDHDQVVGRGHEHHAARREQHERVVLARRQRVQAEEVDGEEDGEGRGGDQEEREEERVAVGAERLPEAAGAVPARPQPERRPRRRRQPDEGDAGERLAIRVGADQVGDHDQHRRRGDQEPGQRHLPVGGEGADVDRRHRRPPAASRGASTLWTRARMRSTDGCMRLRNGAG